jgi:hypothetical protein
MFCLSKAVDQGNSTINKEFNLLFVILSGHRGRKKPSKSFAKVGGKALFVGVFKM